jgi:hypothetical protein
MAEQPWASVDDVKAILHEDEEPIPDDGHVLERLEVNLLEATDVVSAHLEREYDEPDDDNDGVPDDVPPAVRRVVARVALRGFMDSDAETGATGSTQAMGPFSYHVNWAKEAVAGDFYLTGNDELRLAKYRLGTARGAGHVPMVGSGFDWWA